MKVKKSQIYRDLADKCGFYVRDTKIVVDAIGELILDYLSEAELDDPVEIRLADGILIEGKIVPARERRDPRTNTPIHCAETFKPWVTFSQQFRKILQDRYDERHEVET